jgi:DNA ligase (NAD+)
MQNHREQVLDLLNELDIIEPKSSDTIESTSNIGGKSFCVTGSFAEMSRDAIHALIEEQGGAVRSAVSAKLDYLIVGENAGSKYTKAQELGVVCLTLEEFLDMIKKTT